MKTFLNIARRILLRTCILYTVLSLVLFLIGSAIPQFGNMIEVSGLLTIFAFALLLAVAGLILGVERFPIALRVALHYLASLATYLVIFVFIAQKASGATAIFSNTVFFTILYALVMGIYLFAYYSLKKDEKQEKKGEGYQRIYK